MYVLRGLSLQLFLHFQQKIPLFFDIVQNSENSRLEQAKIV